MDILGGGPRGDQTLNEKAPSAGRGWITRTLIWFVQSIVALGLVSVGVSITVGGDDVATALLAALGVLASGLLLMRQVSRYVAQEIERSRADESAADVA